MGVVEPVVDHAAVPAVSHDPGRPEQTHGVGHRRLRNPHRGGEVAHAQLSTLQERMEDAQSVRVAEQLEVGRERGGFLVTDESAPGAGDLVSID